MPMQRTHDPILTPEQYEREKATEAERRRFDPGYVTAEEAAAIPEHLRNDPAVKARVQHSREHWPEERASMAQALPPASLPGGQGETTEGRAIDAEAGGFFSEGKAQGADPDGGVGEA